MKKMPTSFIFFFFFFISIIFLSAEADDCPPARCRKHGPSIEFPFRLIGKQSPNCSYTYPDPAFDFYCNTKDETMLNLPNSVTLKVEKIYYPTQQIRLSDPQKCLSQTLQPLNLFSSPFKFVTDYASALDNFVLFNCSASKTDMSPVKSCGGSGDKIYAVSSDSYMDSLSLTSCTSWHNVSSVPRYIFQKDDVVLNWSKPLCVCHSRRQKCAAPLRGNATAEFQCVDIHKEHKKERTIAAYLRPYS